MAWSDYYPFLKAPALKAITDAIDALATAGGSGVPDNWYDTVAEIRAITGYSDNDVVGLTPSAYLYQFDAAETTADDGNNYLTPDDITEPAPGRWVKILAFSLVGHSHSDKVDIPNPITINEYLTMDASGNIIFSGDGTNKFVEIVAGKDLSTNDFTDALLAKLNGLPDTVDLDGKMDIITPTGSNEGNIVILDSAGNSDDSGVKPIDMVHSVGGTEQSTSQGGTIQYIFRDITEWKTATIFATLYTSSLKIPIKIIVPNEAGNAWHAAPEVWLPGFEDVIFTASVTLNGNIPTLNLEMTTTPETIYCTTPKIIYN